MTRPMEPTEAAAGQGVPRPPTGVGDGRELLAWLRLMRDRHPVWRDETTGALHVFRYADLLHVLSTPAVFSSDFSAIMPPPEEGAPNFTEGVLTMTDPPRHGKLRRLVSQAFTPRMIAQLEPKVVGLTRELFDTVAGADDFDLVASVAYPLPVIVIAEMLGIPAADRELFRTWGEALLSTNYELPVGAVPDGTMPEDIVRQLSEMHAYLLGHVRDRRATQRGDLISSLVAAEVDGDRLTDGETVSFLNFLLLAGHLTTSLLMGNTLLSFADHPDQADAVRADRELVPRAIEEVLRHRPPVVFQARVTREETELAGVTVPAKVPVMCWQMSGNRDERHFPDPDRFDIGRTPNAHLTFGHGIHFCIGTPLARLESRIVLNELLDRYRDIGCGTPVFYERSPEIFGVKSLPITVQHA
ncbi:cytochrome P450 [Streptomyces sp. NBC_01803]|uniref:cytochrome P450 n=1 Tax=Streptomyces sp. NBC_01803 TaxID=2975946 RepID=UPI002DD97597|nr:cytochrome P450 [Streptomyces sp. NBC_01803]WSA43088.1 cytochrome P450 [Streptomyces sp. NBC_01803]